MRATTSPLVDFSSDFNEKQLRLGTFLSETFYSHYKIVRMTDKGKRVIGALIEAYQQNPKLLPPALQQRYEPTENRKQVLANHIAGMTDRYALVEYRRLFDPDVRV